MIEIRNVHKHYDQGKSYAVHALRGLSATFESGTSYAIMGVSGSGKSTLLNILGCVDTAFSGQYWLDGQDVSALSLGKRNRLHAQKIGFVLQSYGLIWDIDALDNCMAPAIFAGCSIREAKRRAQHALERVGIGDLAKRPAGKLSGGQKQRVAIARALVNQPLLVLADEPTGALDSKTAQEIQSLLLDVASKDSTLIIATHSQAIADSCAHTLCIKDGQWEE